MTTPMISALPTAAVPTPEAGGATAPPAAGFGAMLAAALVPGAATAPTLAAVPGLPADAVEETPAEGDEAVVTDDEAGEEQEDATLLDAFLLTTAVAGTTGAPVAVVPAQAPAVALVGLTEAAAQQVAGAVESAPDVVGGPVAVPADGEQPVASAPLASVPTDTAGATAPQTDATVAPAATAPAEGRPTESTAPVLDPAAEPVPDEAVASAERAAPRAAEPVAAPALTRVEAAPSATPVAAAAPVAPAAGVAPSAPVTPAAVVQQIAPHVTSLAESGPGVHRLSLTLDPAELGEVRVVLVQRHEEMHVVLSGSDTARAALQQGSPELRRLLDAVGLPDARVTIADPGTGSGPSPEQRGGQTGDGAREDAPQRGFTGTGASPAPASAPTTVRTPVAATGRSGVDLTI